MKKSVSHMKVIVMILALFIALPIYAQKKSPQKSLTGAASPTVIRTSKDVITLDEFAQAYQRMNDKNPYNTSIDSLKDFMNLYADYRLKLLEAKELGLDKDPKILSEIDGYKKMLAGPFLLEKELTEKTIHTIYERRKWDVNAFHYLAGIRNPNDPEDTLRAYKRALKVIERMNEGEPLMLLAMGDDYMKFLDDKKAWLENERAKKTNSPADTTKWEGSDDRQTAKDGGDLGFFTGGMTVRPFEEAVFSLNVGEYTKVPVRTRFGYHVIQLEKKVPRVGGVKVHHILVAMDKNTPKEDTMRFYLKADSLLRAIKNGAPFEQVARESSDDKFSAEKGGDMDYIDRESRRAEKNFDRTAYALNDGEISDIVRTTFGYHIIRRDGSLPIKTFEEEKDQLKKLYKNYYYNDDKERYLSGLRETYKAKLYNSTVDIFMSRVDSTRTTVDSNWAAKFTPGERGLPVYEIGGKPFTVAALIDSLQVQPGFPLARNSLMEFVNRMINDAALDLATVNIEQKYPDFGTIMTDYKNGIMLFELENRKIWTNVKPDSVKEFAYYQDHKARYLWPERVDVSEIYLFSDSLASALYKRILDGENFDSLAKQYTERPGFKERAGRWGLLQKDENDIARKVFNFPVDDVKPPFEFQAGYSLVKINRRLPVTQKTFTEARPEVASQYQDDLASELRLKWVTDLRKKYNRQLETKVLESEWKKRREEMNIQ